jgi:hypothetical protein
MLDILSLITIDVDYQTLLLLLLVEVIDIRADVDPRPVDGRFAGPCATERRVADTRPK